MKLNKLTFEWLIYHAKHSERAGHTELQIMEEIETALKAGTLEIEGYVRADHFADADKMVWTRFDPNDPKTFPPETGYYIVSIVEQDFTETFYFDGRDDTVRDWTGEVTHWRPLPKPPVESEVGK